MVLLLSKGYAGSISPSRKPSISPVVYQGPFLFRFFIFVGATGRYRLWSPYRCSTDRRERA